MPTYEYKCTACNLRFERRQRIDEDPIRTCPSCNGSTRRVVHPVGIVFKGSGFYATDNRSNWGDESPLKKGATARSESANDGGTSEGKNNSTGSGAEDKKPAEKPAAD